MATTKKATKKPARTNQTTVGKRAATGKKTSGGKRASAARKETTATTKVTAEKTTIPAKRSGTTKGAETGVAVDRRASKERRKLTDRRKKNAKVAVQRRTSQRRAKVNRRRQIDPTTCERDYTPDEIEFMSALDEYKRVSGRMFPTCSEVLEVIKNLGYEKRSPGEPLDQHACELSATPFAG